jgi:hypothetical protein
MAMRLNAAPVKKKWTSGGISAAAKTPPDAEPAMPPRLKEPWNEAEGDGCDDHHSAAARSLDEASGDGHGNQRSDRNHQ